MNDPQCNHEQDVVKPTFYVLVQHQGDYIGWYIHDVVAVSQSRELLESKIEELKKRVPGHGELTGWEYDIQEGVEVL